MLLKENGCTELDDELSEHISKMVFEVMNTEVYKKNWVNEECEFEGEWENKIEEIKANARERKLESESERVIEVLTEYKDVFSNKPRMARDFLGHISVEIKKPIVHNKSYPIPYSKRELVQKEIDNMLEDDIIESSNSPYSNTLVAVTKKDGGVRLCLDARFINKIIIPDPIESHRNLLMRFYKDFRERNF